ncbi:glycosyltransferase [Gelidibacter sp. F2691]|nr:glycosyltransferase [Gelidibacter sp. F2691]
MSTLTIISHTEHYRDSNGQIFGLGSTVTEINHLLEVFDHIVHVAMLYDSEPPASALPYFSNRVSFIALPVVGGVRLLDKLNVIFKAPRILNIVRKAVASTDYFQFRAPTAVGVYVIPYLVFLSQKKGWFKYAGNWEQTHAPIAYRFQKWLLKKQQFPVTINGFWKHQPSHCLSFENPCLTAQEIEVGQLVRNSKTLQFPVDLCYVGRLEPAKGVDLFMEALHNLDTDSRAKIRQVHLVGHGTHMAAYQQQAHKMQLPIVFHSLLSRLDVHAIYKNCHSIILASASEGFPKVIAEAQNYGCVPIVSNVSALSHYIKDGENGFVLKSLDAESLGERLNTFINLKPLEYEVIIANIRMTTYKFSYTHYNQRIISEIL